MFTYCKTYLIYIQKSSWFWYMTQKCSQPIRIQDFLNFITHKTMELWRKFFLWLDTLRANQLIQFFCLILVRHAQLWLDSRFKILDNQDSKILEVRITQENSDYKIIVLYMDTNWEELKVKLVFSRLWYSKT